MITHRIKNIALLVMAILLLISGGLNFIQLNSAKREQENRTADNLRNQIETEGHKARAKSFADQAEKSESKRILDSIQFSKKDSIHVVKIQRLTSKLRLIDTSKSTDKQLDSLINLLYGIRQERTGN